MARRKKNKQEEEVLVDIVEVRDSMQDFYDKNQKLIWGGAVVFLVLIGGFFVYNNLYLQPRQVEAMNQMYQAQKQFEQDSFAKALTNPGSLYPGFLDIADQYKGTKAGNLANYYSGVAYLNLGKFDVATDYLKSYKPQNELMGIMKNGALGDCLSELNDLNGAQSYYEKSVNSNNDLLTPYYLQKLGLLHERNNNPTAAKDAYNRIKKDFPTSKEGVEVDKYLARVN